MEKEMCISMYGTSYCIDKEYKGIKDFCGYCMVFGYTWEKYKKEILDEPAD